MNGDDEGFAIKERRVEVRNPEEIGVAISSAKAQKLLSKAVDSGFGIEYLDARIEQPGGVADQSRCGDDADDVGLKQREQVRQQVAQITPDAGVPVHAEVDGDACLPAPWSSDYAVPVMPPLVRRAQNQPGARGQSRWRMRLATREPRKRTQAIAGMGA